MADTTQRIAKKDLTAPSVVKEELKEAVYINMWKQADASGNTGLVERIEKAWEKSQGVPFDHDLTLDDQINFALMGPPGQGKTTSVMVASREVCKEVGLNFVDVSGVENDFEPGENDFVFCNINLGGATSAIDLGLPALGETKGGERYMDRTPHRIFALSQKAVGSLLFFDDVTNAYEKVVGPLLEITENKAFGTAKLGDATTVVLAGNTKGDGSVGTMQNLGAALNDRVKVFQVEDTPKDWVKRWEQDVVASAFSDQNKSLKLLMASLVERGENLGFLKDGRFYSEYTKDSTGTVTPRSLYKFGGQLTKMMSRYKRGKSFSSLVDAVDNEVKGIFGNAQAASAISTYVSSYLEGAQEFAQRIFESKDKKGAERIADEVSKKMSSDGEASAESFGFAYKYSNALSNEFLVKVSSLLKDGVENPIEKIQELGVRLGEGLAVTSPSQQSKSLDIFMRRATSRLSSEFLIKTSHGNTDNERHLLRKDLAVGILKGLMNSNIKVGQDELIGIFTNSGSMGEDDSLGLK
ncbi:MAG: hypothetical protein IBX55_01305 [Methyloprofundus sp.]|nr:hypothetical protein [Methyloprofundus sp.]